LQIADGGLTNISQILDRLKTLATESASNTFTGSRSTLNNEYQSLLSEITRQASNIGLVNNGSMNKQLQVYIGGGNTQANAQVSVDLSGTQNQVDAAGLGVGSTNIMGGGITLAGNTVTDLNNPGLMILQNATAADGTTQNFTFNYINAGVAANATFSVTSNAGAGITVAAALSQLNTQLGTIGLSASVNSSGALVIGGGSPFTLTAVSTNYNGGSQQGTTTDLVTPGAGINPNTGVYNTTTTVASLVGATGPETLAFSNGTVTKYATFTAADLTAANFATDVNSQVGSMGIYALATNGTAGLSLQSSGSFTVTMVTGEVGGAANSGLFGSTANGMLAATATGPNQGASATGNSLAALTAIENAVADLGQVQGRVGAGENTLNDAINLAQSQITNFSSAESQIRDANIAAEAANLSKAQVLQQSSIAAMAQANSAPQAVLKLLQ